MKDTALLAHNRNNIILFSMAALGVLVFVGDLMAPHGYNVWLFYLFPLLLSLLLPTKGASYIAMAPLAGLVLLGLFIKYAGVPVRFVVFNRVTGILCGGIVALILERYRTLMKAREETSQKLEQKEEEYRTLVEHSPHSIARFDRAFRYLYVNPAGGQMVVMTKEQMLGRTNTELGLPDELVASWHERFRQVFDVKQEVDMEFTHAGPRGARHYSASIVPEFDRYGNVVSLLTITSDITQMKEIQQRLSDAVRESRQKTREANERERILEAMLRNLPESIVVLKAPEGKLLMASKAYEDIIGIPMEQLARMPPAEWLRLLQAFYRDTPGFTAPENLSSVRALKKGEVIVGEEWKLTKRDGTTLTFSAVAAPIRDEKGTITHSITAYRDITERKRMETELRRNEHELRTLVDNSPDLIVRFDRSLRYAYVNPAYERITGILREQFAGKTNTELGMAGELKKILDAALEKVIETGREASIEFGFSGLLGKRYFWGRLIPEFDKGGLVDTILLLARDITERRKAEEQVRFISFHDQVTGLYNRAYAEEEMRRIDNERELPISIIMGDVNNLKLTNDVFGHEEGDRLLGKIAQILKKSCRRNDVIARWGGDEFVVVLPKTGATNARELSGRIEEECGKINSMPLVPSIALGIAVKARPEQNIYRILRGAEEEMYRDKALLAEKNQKQIISAMGKALVGKRPETGEHIERLKGLIQKNARVLNLTNKNISSLKVVAELHEIGKITVPEEIWLKHGKLLPREWEAMKKHSGIPYRISRTFGDLSPVSDILIALDERWDGEGRPKGLKGGAIPYLARVFNVLDAFDVMTHPRPYGAPLSTEEAVRELERNAGRQFDPGTVNAFVVAMRLHTRDEARSDGAMK